MAQSPPFSDVVVNSDCPDYQGLKVLSRFPSGQFNLDGFRQTLVDSCNQCIRIIPTLSAEGAELNAEVTHWSGTLAEVEVGLTASRPPTRWLTTCCSSAVKATMNLHDVSIA